MQKPGCSSLPYHLDVYQLTYTILLHPLLVVLPCAGNGMGVYAQPVSRSPCCALPDPLRQLTDHLLCDQSLLGLTQPVLCHDWVGMVGVYCQWTGCLGHRSVLHVLLHVPVHGLSPTVLTTGPL